jgi:hypothetical protein
MANWLRFIVAFIVGAHGIGHMLFLVSLWGVADWGQSTRSWLLGDGWLAKVPGGLLWLMVMGGFVAAAAGFFNQAEWWRPMAIVSAVLSSVGLFLFWANPASSPALSALVFNLLVLGALLVFHWPPVAQLSS